MRSNITGKTLFGLAVATLVGVLALPAQAADRRKKADDDSNRSQDDSGRGKGASKGAPKGGNSKGRDEGAGGQSDAARKSIDKQKSIATGLRDKAESDPATLQAMIDDLRRQLADETTRHDAAVERLNADVAASASDKKGSSRAKRALDDENKSYASRKASIERQIASLQAKLDGLSKPDQTSTPSGDRPSGDRPSGDRPSGDRPSGDRPSGDRPATEDPGSLVPPRPQAPLRLLPPPRPTAPQ